MKIPTGDVEHAEAFEERIEARERKQQDIRRVRLMKKKGSRR